MFKLFGKKKPSSPFEDAVYLTKANKYKAIGKLMAQDSGQPRWLIYHFAHTAQEAAAVWQALGHTVGQASNLAEASAPGNWLLAATLFTGGRLGRLTAQPELLLLEHYPIPAPEQALGTALQQLFPGQQLKVYTGLDEPLMQQFGAERMTTLMERMNVDPDEELSHSMITKSIARAQEQLAKKARGNASASSQEAWFASNL